MSKQHILANESWNLKNYLGISAVAELKNGILTDSVFFTGRKEYSNDEKIIITMKLNELMVFCRSIDRTIAIVSKRKQYNPESYEKIVDSRKAGVMDGGIKKLYFGYKDENKTFYLNLFDRSIGQNGLKIPYGFNVVEFSSMSEILKVFVSEAKKEFYRLQREGVNKASETKEELKGEYL